MRGRWGLLALVVGLWCGCADRERSAIADGRLTATPGGIDFTRVAIFDGREAEITLRNVGRARITVNAAWVEGPDGAYLARFATEGPHSLVPGSESTLRVRFTPQQSGDAPGMLYIRSDARIEPILKLPLSGLGVDAWARLSPRRLDFGRIEAESTKTLGVALHNPSELTVEVTPTLVGADRDEFALAPVTLAPGEQKELPVTFSPARVGRKQVALAITPCKGCADVPVLVTAEALDRAVIAEPPELDFGAVPVDKDRWLTSTLRNISTEPMTVTGLTLEGRDASFSHAATGFPLVLQPGEVRRFEMRYSPGHMGKAEDRALYRVVSKRNPTTPVGLKGHGGAAELCISPLSHDFGLRPLGSKTPVTVNIKNCGADNGGPLTIHTLDFLPDPAGAQFSRDPAVVPPLTLAPGQEANVRVFYEPLREGAAAGSLVVTSNAFNAARVQLEFRGTAQEHAPCMLAITPEALDFGTVPPKRGAVLGVKVENRGTDLCPVKNIRVADSGGGVFLMPGGELVGGIMFPGDWFSFQVAFVAPASGGSFMGMVHIEQADPVHPVLEVPLKAHSERSCLVPTPWFVDFGVARRDCPPLPRQVNYFNGCAAPVSVSNIFIGPGTTDVEFALRSRPGVPLTLEPGEAFTVEVDYFAQVFGMNLSPLFVAASDLPEPLLVPLIGESSKRVEQVDTFVQQDGQKVDVLFVVDNTASMVEEQPRFISALPAFVDTALAKGVDMHVAVTSTGMTPASAACPGGGLGGEAGRFTPVDNSRPRILTQATPNLARLLQQNAQVGMCAQVEQGLEAVRRAISEPLVNSADDPRTPPPNDGNLGFLRNEAALVVVFVGDEDDHSPDSVDTYVRYFQARKGEHQPQRVTLFAIAPTAAACGTAGGVGTRYAEAAARTGGQVVSVCEPDYAPLLRTVANKAFSAQDRFPLSEQPDPGTIGVTVDGVPATGSWSYDPRTNSVVFSASPPPGAKVQISYRRACP
ncbi:choice-of-anchor D domain-containing protein [Myxococcaceae bacterium GXIMD 01537]